MSITAETAQEHKNDPAVLCCRLEAGNQIQPANLEDPAIFDDLVDSGLLNLDGCLKISQVLGATLTKTCDSLSPITADAVDKIQEEEEEAPALEAAPEEAPTPAPAVSVASPVSGGTLKIHIGEGKGNQLEIPMGFSGGNGVAAVPAAASEEMKDAPKQKNPQK